VVTFISTLDTGVARNLDWEGGSKGRNFVTLFWLRFWWSN